MEITLFNFSFFVPAYIGAPLLAGVHFVLSHILPWAVGVFFATRLQTYKPPMTRFKALVTAFLFIAVGIVLMPLLVVLFSHLFGAKIDFIYGLSLLAAYGLSWVIFVRKSNE